ncbi:MAG TPA: hypothetical protein DIC60_10720 [Lachnospiraceae bacterium]|nr:hypothetical protein [Lachnospiraceae bacterium]
MIQKNKRPIPKEFRIQNPVASPQKSNIKEEPKVIFTAEKSSKKEPNPCNIPATNSKNILRPAVAAMLLMDVLK